MSSGPTTTVADNKSPVSAPRLPRRQQQEEQDNNDEFVTIERAADTPAANNDNTPVTPTRGTTRELPNEKNNGGDQPTTKRRRGRPPKATAAAQLPTKRSYTTTKKRERFPLDYKARLIRAFEEWKRQQLEKNERRIKKKDPPTVKEFCHKHGLEVKFQTYLSDQDVGGWRYPSKRQQILQQADAAGFLPLQKKRKQQKRRRQNQQQEDSSSSSDEESGGSQDDFDEEGKIENDEQATTPSKRKKAAARNEAPSIANDKTATTKRPKKTPRKDGRKSNKGAPTRESYSVAYKAKMIQDFEAWEAASMVQGKASSIKEYLRLRQLPHKYEKFLGSTAAGGWRYGPTKERILADASGETKSFKRIASDPLKNRSHVADMEEKLLARLADMRDDHVTITTAVLRQLAKEEWNKLHGDYSDNNDNENDDNTAGGDLNKKKKKTFSASNGWVYNFVKRQKKTNKLLRQIQHDPTANGGTVDDGGEPDDDEQSDDEQLQDGALNDGAELGEGQENSTMVML